MKKNVRKIASFILMGLMMFIPILSTVTLPIHAAQTSSIKNSFYEVTGDDWKYTISNTSPIGTSSETLGSMTISGDTSSISSVDGYTSFEVKSDVVSFNYSLGSLYTGTDEYSWHITSDKSKDFDGIKLDSNIQNGALIVQTSFSGYDWLTESVYTDIAGEKSTFSSDFYSSKPI